jgi:asparagine synthase (glutamine-hydrolysing)
LTAEAVAEGETTGFVRYWRPTAVQHEPSGEASERFAEVLRSAVSLRLRSDVPVGLTLSGGLDSSSIACIASQLLAGERQGNPLSAFTAVFDDAGFSEEAYADLVARRASLHGIKVRPSSGDLRKDWWTFVRCMEQPFRGLSYYSNWKIYAAIRETGIKVLLNGQGGDELLLGYERYRVPYLRYLLRRSEYGRALTEIRYGAERGRMGLLRLLAYVAYFGMPAVRISARLHRVGRYLRPDFLDYVRRRSEVVREESSRQSFETWMSAEFERFQLPHLLQHEDRVSMHHAVESRSPFLDFRLFQFVLGCGPEMLIRNGWSKALLREAMKGTIPDEVRLRTDKMGYDTPTGRLFRDERVFFDGILSESASDRLVDVRRVKDDFAAGRMDAESLCSVLSYLSWRMEFGVVA